MSNTTTSQDVVITGDGVRLPGTLSIPAPCRGIVLFAHGSGSSRLSPRNTEVARSLVARGCGTLLFDLLTDAEAGDRRNVFDIDLLGDRVVAATRWLTAQPGLADAVIGYFGASTGAAAALVAAATMGDRIAAVVSRGGRPDLAAEHLARVTAPTLLIVGSLDTQVLDLNRQAAAMLTCEQQVHIVDGATHLFEEPGTLERVEEVAGLWFTDRFGAPETAMPGQAS